MKAQTVILTVVIFFVCFIQVGKISDLCIVKSKALKVHNLVVLKIGLHNDSYLVAKVQT